MELDKKAIAADLVADPDLIHFDNAGASLMPRPVLDTQLAHLLLEAELGGYQAEAERMSAIEAVYDSIGSLINCHRDEVAVVENATVGWMMAFYAQPFEPGDRILTAEAEYASNYLAYLQLVKQRGVLVETIPSTADGEVDVEALRGMIDARVRLIAITHVPTNGGLVNPVEEIGAVAREHGIFYLVDACQSAGQIDLDVDKIQCDALSATGRKYLRGPRGSGFLYVRRSALAGLHPPVVDLFSATWTGPDSYELRADARRFENWENNYAAKLGLGAAVDYALALGMPAIEAEVTRLAAKLRERLAEIDSVTVHDIGRRRCGIVTFAVDGIDAGTVSDRLRQHRIHTSVSGPSSTLIDATRRGLPSLVRSSVHYFNRDDEIDRFVETLGSIVGNG